MQRLSSSTVGMFFIALFWMGTASAQSFSRSVKPYEINYKMAFQPEIELEGIKGSPFLFEQSKTADIALSGGKMHTNIPFNILPEKDEVLILPGDIELDPLVIRNWEWIKTTDENPRLFRWENLEGKRRIVEVLYEKEGEKYVALHRKPLIPAPAFKDSYSGPLFDNFAQDTRYFVLNGLKSREIRTNSTGLKELAKEKNNALRDFIRTEKLKPEQSDHMKRILVFLMD